MMQSYALCPVYAIVVPYDVRSCPLRREELSFCLCGVCQSQWLSHLVISHLVIFEC